MPGTGIPDFASRARTMAKAGVYDFAIHHDQILVPVVTQRWGLTRLTGLTAEAERARDTLVEYIDRLGKVARRVEARREMSRSVDAA
jgi:acyl-[acyl-carrier-protein] desaturase